MHIHQRSVVLVTALFTFTTALLFEEPASAAVPAAIASLRRDVPYVPMFTEANGCFENGQVNSLPLGQRSDRLAQIAKWYRHVHAEAANKTPLGIGCAGTGASTLAAELSDRGLMVSNYRNGSYTSQSSSPLDPNFAEAASLEARAPRAIQTFWPGTAAPGGDDAAGAARLTRALDASASKVLVASSDGPAGSAATWPYISSRGTGALPGTHSANTHDFVSWIRVDEELMKITAPPLALSSDISLTVERGLWGTAITSHPVGARVESPVYIGSATAQSSDEHLSGTPKVDSVTDALRYGIQIGRSDAQAWLGQQIRRNFGPGLGGYNTVWLDVSSCNMYNNSDPFGNPVVGWDQERETKLTRERWGELQADKVAALQIAFPGVAFTGNSLVSLVDDCNDSLLANAFDGGVLEHWMKQDPANFTMDWEKALEQSFRIQLNNWPALHWMRFNYAFSGDPEQYKRFAYASLLLTRRATADRTKLGGNWGLNRQDDMFFWDLGAPWGDPVSLGEVAVLSVPGLYRRSFDNGLVLVNPGTTPITYDLATQHYDIGRPDASGNPTATSSVTIGPNDAALLLRTPVNPLVPLITIDNAKVQEGHTGLRGATLTARLSQPSTETVTISYRTVDDTATAGTDYEATSGQLSFAPGETAKQIVVDVRGDRMSEANESLLIRLYDPRNTIIQDGIGRMDIGNDDALPSFNLGPATVVERVGADATVAVPIGLSAPSDTTAKVTWTTLPGSAVAGADYVADVGVAYFAPGTTLANAFIKVMGDNKPEGEESFTVSLSGNFGADMGTDSATVTISDPVPTMSVDDTSAVEGDLGTGGRARFVVSLNTASVAPLTFGYVTVGGSATSGVDFLPASGTVTIPAAALSVTVVVQLQGDGVNEPNETFGLKISTSDAAKLGSSFATNTILDDD